MTQSYLYSIGHGNKSIEELISTLRNYGITYLIDVRSKPYSKYYPQFNKEALMLSINATGDIHYGYMGDLIGGLPQDPSCMTNGKMDYEKMKRTTNFQTGLSRIMHANEMGLKTCVMCSEGNPAECHRSKLIGEALWEHGIIMQHIVKSKVGRYVIKSQIDVINEVVSNSIVSLFGDTETLTSRKTYQI